MTKFSGGLHNSRLKDILRLAAKLSNSQRKIVMSVGSSHCTVKETLETAKLKGSEWPIDDSVSNEMPTSILFSAKSTGYLEPDYEYIHRELFQTWSHNDTSLARI